MIICRLQNTGFGMNIYGSGTISSARDACGNVSYAAIEESQIIGVLVIHKKPKGVKTVRSIGTSVRPFRRRRGVGKALWRAMIKAEKPNKIIVNIATNKGYTLVNSLRDTFPKIKWAVENHGYRSLKKRKKRG